MLAPGGRLIGSTSQLEAFHSRSVSNWTPYGLTLLFEGLRRDIAGHLLEIFKTLRPANDLEFRYGVNAPTVRIEGLTLGGR